MSLRGKLIVVFLAATLVPMAAMLWVTSQLLETSMQYATTRELDEMSRTLEATGRAVYQQAKEKLQRQRAAGQPFASRFPAREITSWPPEIAAFAASGQSERFLLSGPSGERLRLLARQPDGSVGVLETGIGGMGMNPISRQFARARELVGRARDLDMRRGLTFTLLAAAAGLYLSALLVLVLLAVRISRPMRELTTGLQRLAAGDFAARLRGEGPDEAGQAIAAFNQTASRLAESRDRVVHLARVASWQSLARKMAHEVKNSLTPIRLTMEEIGVHNGSVDAAFLKQASAIVADEVTTLERRVRAFSEFASEPAVALRPVDADSLVEDRLSLLRPAYPEVRFETLFEARRHVLADPDLLKGALHNLLENAAQAAGPGGAVRVRSFLDASEVCLEIMDSGPGLSELARSTLFEPTISFKKNGMGLGLSIARRGIVSCGGSIRHRDGSLGGASFVVALPCANSTEESKRYA